MDIEENKKAKPWPVTGAQLSLFFSLPLFVRRREPSPAISLADLGNASAKDGVVTSHDHVTGEGIFIIADLYGILAGII